MPELPEVETIRLGLARHVWGRTVAEASVLHPRAVRRQGGGAQETVARLTGCTFGAVDRRGKYLWLPLAEPGASQGELPGAALLVHLGMSGQLLVRGPGGSVDAVDAVEPAGEAGAPAPPDPARHLRVRLRLDDGGELWFVDQRTFGHVMVADLVPTADGGTGGGVPDDLTLLGDDGPAPMSGLPLVPAPVSHIARDLLDPALELSALVRATRARRTEVKRALLDQSLVSGIGNIYADEALWRARLHGRRATDALAPARARELYAGAGDVLREAVAAGGTSFDELYVDVDGASGYFARDLAVYGREGLPCRRCGRPIRREAFMNRSSYSCPSCQRKC